jgi:two-component system, OmpR family, alkaline phosphatase synthesis response regulator PhoP
MEKQKLLLVDDEPDIVTTVKYRLEASGYEVVTAGDGQEALEKARKENPALIILDLMLPKLNGYEVCTMLKQDEDYKKIPIMMFTARAQEADEKQGMECGADAYMHKPFEPAKLLETIHALIGEK